MALKGLVGALERFSRKLLPPAVPTFKTAKTLYTRSK